MEMFGKRQLSSATIFSSMNELHLSMIYKLKHQAIKASVGNIIPEVNVWDVFLNV